MHRKIVIFVAIGIFYNKGFKFEVDVCNECHELLMMSVNLSNIANLKIHGIAYGCIINEISKSETMRLLINVNPNEKNGKL